MYKSVAIKILPEECWNSVPRLNPLKRNKDSLLNLNTQKNKRANSHDSQLFRDENLIDHRSIDDLLDHQRSYLIINHQVSSLTPNKYHLINKNKQYLNLANNSSRCYSQELLYQQKKTGITLLKAFSIRGTISTIT
ncbi:hypothetical protein H4Q26_005324 [Puccinia striiformis f. sp. tritici PST-130]|nr:hypothetical protein H4Q26_005324 [Puccinia striiformis f. sp. tritici PST-130]